MSRPGRRKALEEPEWCKGPDLFGDSASAFGGDKKLAEDRRRASLASSSSSAGGGPEFDSSSASSPELEEPQPLPADLRAPPLPARPPSIPSAADKLLASSASTRAATKEPTITGEEEQRPCAAASGEKTEGDPTPTHHCALEDEIGFDEFGSPEGNLLGKNESTLIFQSAEPEARRGGSSSSSSSCLAELGVGGGEEQSSRQEDASCINPVEVSFDSSRNCSNFVQAESETKAGPLHEESRCASETKEASSSSEAEAINAKEGGRQPQHSVQSALSSGIFGSGGSSSQLPSTGLTTATTAFGGATTGVKFGEEGSIFGKKLTEGTSLFGGSKDSPTGGIFGASKDGSAGGIFGASKDGSAGGIFGASKESSAGGIFGASKDGSAGGIFGAFKDSPAGSLFGSSSTSLLGSKGSSSSTTFSSCPNGASSTLFSTYAERRKNIFGARAEEADGSYHMGSRLLQPRDRVAATESFGVKGLWSASSSSSTDGSAPVVAGSSLASASKPEFDSDSKTVAPPPDQATAATEATAMEASAMEAPAQPADGTLAERFRVAFAPASNSASSTSKAPTAGAADKPQDIPAKADAFGVPRSAQPDSKGSGFGAASPISAASPLEAFHIRFDPGSSAKKSSIDDPFDADLIGTPEEPGSSDSGSDISSGGLLGQSDAAFEEGQGRSPGGDVLDEKAGADDGEKGEACAGGRDAATSSSSTTPVKQLRGRASEGASEAEGSTSRAGGDGAAVAAASEEGIMSPEKTPVCSPMESSAFQSMDASRLGSARVQTASSPVDSSAFHPAAEVVPEPSEKGETREISSEAAGPPAAAEEREPAEVSLLVEAHAEPSSTIRCSAGGAAAESCDERQAAAFSPSPPPQQILVDTQTQMKMDKTETKEPAASTKSGKRSLQCTPEKQEGKHSVTAGCSRTQSQGGLFPAVTDEPGDQVTGLFRRSSSGRRKSEGGQGARMSLGSSSSLVRDESKSRLLEKSVNGEGSSENASCCETADCRTVTSHRTAVERPVGHMAQQTDSLVEEQKQPLPASMRFGSRPDGLSELPERMEQPDFSRIPIPTRLQSKDVQARVSAWHALRDQYREISVSGPTDARAKEQLLATDVYLEKVADEQLPVAYEAAITAATRYAELVVAAGHGDPQQQERDGEPALLALTAKLLAHKHMGERRMQTLLTKLWAVVAGIGGGLGFRVGLCEQLREKFSSWTATLADASGKAKAQHGLVKKALNTGMLLMTSLLSVGESGRSPPEKYGKGKAEELVTFTHLLAVTAAKFLQERQLRDSCYAALAEAETLAGERAFADWTRGLLSDPQKKELASRRAAALAGVVVGTSKSASSSSRPPCEEDLGNDLRQAPHQIELQEHDLPEFDLMGSLPRRYALSALDACSRWQDKKEHLNILTRLLRQRPAAEQRLKPDPDVFVLLPGLMKVVKTEQNHNVLHEALRAALILMHLAKGLGRKLFEKHARAVLRGCLSRLSDKNLWKVVEDAAFEVAQTVSLPRLLEDLKFDDTSPHARMMSLRFLRRFLQSSIGVSLSEQSPEESFLEDVRLIAMKAAGEDPEKGVREQALTLLAEAVCQGNKHTAARVCAELPFSRRKAFEEIWQDLRGNCSSSPSDVHKEQLPARGGEPRPSRIVLGEQPPKPSSLMSAGPTIADNSSALLPQQGGLQLLTQPQRGLAKSLSERRLPRSRLNSTSASRMTSPRASAPTSASGNGPPHTLTSADRAAGLVPEHFPAEYKIFESASRVSVTGLQALAQHWQNLFKGERGGNGIEPPSSGAVEAFVTTLYEKTMHFADARPLAARAFLQFFHVVCQNTSAAEPNLQGAKPTAKVARLIVPRLVEMAGDAKLGDTVETCLLNLAESCGPAVVVDIVCQGGKGSGLGGPRRLRQLEQRVSLVCGLVSAFTLQPCGGVSPGVCELLMDAFASRQAADRRAAFRLAELMCRYQTREKGPHVFQALESSITNDDAYRRLHELYGSGAAHPDRPPPVPSRGGGAPSLGTSGGEKQLVHPTSGAAASPAKGQATAPVVLAAKTRLARVESSFGSRNGCNSTEAQSSCSRRSTHESGRSHDSCQVGHHYNPHTQTLDASFLAEEQKRYSGGQIVDGNSAEHDFRHREKEYQRQIQDLRSQIAKEREGNNLYTANNGSMLSEAPSSIPVQSCVPRHAGESVLELKERLESGGAGTASSSLSGVPPDVRSAAPCSTSGSFGTAKSGTPPPRSFSGNARRRLSTKLQPPPEANSEARGPRGQSPRASTHHQSRGGLRAASPRGMTSRSTCSRGTSSGTDLATTAASSQFDRRGRSSTSSQSQQLEQIIRQFDIYEPPRAAASRIGGKELRQNAFVFLWGPEDIPGEGVRQLHEQCKLALPDAIHARMFDLSRPDELLVALEAWSQNVEAFALEIVEILDVVFRYVTFLLHRVTNTRVGNATVDLLLRVVHVLECRNYVPTEKEALVLLPVLGEKLGHNQKAVREALCTVLRRFLNLYPREQLPKSVLLALVRGCASKNKKSVCDLLGEIENLLVLGQRFEFDPRSTTSSTCPPEMNKVMEKVEKVDSRLCFLLAKSQRDVVILCNLISDHQGGSGNTEVKKLAFSVIHHLLLGLDYETFYHCVRKNVRDRSLALQQIDQWIARHDLARPPPVPPLGGGGNSSANCGSLNSSFQNQSRSVLSESREELLGRDEHTQSALNKPRLAGYAGESNHQKPPRPAQLSSPSARRSPVGRASPSGSFGALAASSGDRKPRYSIGSPSLRGLGPRPPTSATKHSASPHNSRGGNSGYPPQYSAPRPSTREAERGPAKVFAKVAEMIATNDSSCLAAIENDAIKMRNAAKEDASALLSAALECKSFPLVRAVVVSYLEHGASPVAAHLLEKLVAHLLSDLFLVERLPTSVERGVFQLAESVVEHLMPAEPKLAISLHDSLQREKKRFESSNRDPSELEQQLDALDAYAFPGSGETVEVARFRAVVRKMQTNLTDHTAGTSSSRLVDRTLLAARLVPLLKKHFPADEVPSAAAFPLIELCTTYVQQLALERSLPEQTAVRALLHTLLITLMKSSSWAGSSRKGVAVGEKENQELLEKTNLCTVQLMVAVSGGSCRGHITAYQMILSFTVVEKDVSHNLIQKCVKKLNKALTFCSSQEREGEGASDEALKEWVYSLLLDYAQKCEHLDEQGVKMAIVTGTAIYDCLVKNAQALDRDRGTENGADGCGIAARLEQVVEEGMNCLEAQHADATRAIFGGFTRRFEK